MPKTTVQKNDQGGFRDQKIEAAEIVKLLTEAEQYRSAYDSFRSLQKEARDKVLGLAVEVPEGEEVRLALIGDEGTYGVTLRHHGPSSVEFERKGGVRAGRITRVE